MWQVIIKSENNFAKVRQGMTSFIITYYCSYKFLSTLNTKEYNKQLVQVVTEMCFYYLEASFFPNVHLFLQVTLNSPSLRICICRWGWWELHAPNQLGNSLSKWLHHFCPPTSLTGHNSKLLLHLYKKQMFKRVDFPFLVGYLEMYAIA